MEEARTEVMMRVLLIGTGRAAQHLGHAIMNAGHNVIGVVGRDEAKARSLADELRTGSLAFDAIRPEHHVALIAVSDDALAEVAAGIPQSDAVVCHVSGAKSMDVLQPHRHRGVLWPVQSLAEGAQVDITKSPLVVDASDDGTRATLIALARSISQRVLELDHNDRQVLHAAAVIAGNFPVFLLTEAQRLLSDHDLPGELLLPLWTNSTARAAALGPRQALTGPARRGDVKTLQAHLDLLAADPDIRRVYALLSRSILKAHGHPTDGLEDL